MKLTRIGDAEGETVETQHRATLPAVGDVIDVTVGGMLVRARVIRVSPSSGAEGHFTIDVDKLSSGYLLETLSALAQSDHGKLSSDEIASMKATKPHSATGAKTAVPLTLKTQKDKFSYALGMKMGANLHKQSVAVDPNILARGLKHRALDTRDLAPGESRRA